jgi:mono/diheme cytochrome c family protein
MKPLSTLLSAGFAIALLALLPGMEAQAANNAEKGRVFVESNCARCHAIGLDDDSHMPEAPPLRSLHTRYPIDSLTEAFAEGIVTGHPQMPEFQLDTDTISDMLAYIKSLSGTGQ